VTVYLYRATILLSLPIQPLLNPDNLSPPSTSDLADADYRALADFRLHIRRFLHFSEEAARSEGLEPQQHQFLLTVRALTGSTDSPGGGPRSDPYSPTVGEIAARLLIRHHSAVGLADRLVERGLVERGRGDGDRRQVRIRLTIQGENAIMRLSTTHREVLLNTGPLLVESLGALLQRRREKDDVPKTQNRNP
jgi:DNA-binding MarR family transcriptional regulator